MFRVAAKKIFLTYTTHLNKEALHRHITSLGATSFLRSAHETGETGHPHTHTLIEFQRKFESTNQRVFDFNEQHPNIETIKTIEHWKNTKRYLSKQDPENNDLKEDDNIIDGIHKCQTELDALRKYARKPSDAIGVSTIYNKRPMITEPIERPTLEWSNVLINELNNAADNRKILWYYDESGGKGKSWTAKYLCQSPEYIIFKRCDGGRNISHILLKHIRNHPELKAVIFDLPRSYQDRDIYEVMECIKDRMITSTKYDGVTQLLPKNLHVVVFANFLPERNSMSADRFDIRTL